MTFADLVAADTVFIDSNTFTYHFQPHPKWGPHCQQLLQRIENLEISGFTSLHVLGEVAHRMMTIEAHALWGWPFAGIGNRLRSNPAQVRKVEQLPPSNRQNPFGQAAAVADGFVTPFQCDGLQSVHRAARE